MIKTIANDIKKAGGTMMYVGGFVRDELMGVKSNDVDVVVFGLDTNTVGDILRKRVSTKVAGNEFPVFKFSASGKSYDVAIARKEISTGDGYHDVRFSFDNVSIFDDAMRRDLTINAIYKDVITGEIHDPVGGVHDIKHKILRHSSHKFAESSERPLRLAQILSRFPDFSVDQSTISVCRGMSDKFHNIPKEQLRQQFVKMLCGKKPSKAIMILEQTGWLKHFKAINDLRRLPQDPIHHPEGDVLTHTMMVCDKMAELCDEINADRFKMVLSALIHDMGKTTTTQEEDGRITSKGHQKADESARTFMEQIDVPLKIRDFALAMMHNHMKRSISTPRGVRRLARKLGNKATIQELCMLMEADTLGRWSDKSTDDVNRIRKLAEQQNVIEKPQKPIVNGHTLINEHGLPEGKLIGKILKELSIAQEDGLLTEENAKTYTTTVVERNLTCTDFTD